MLGCLNMQFQGKKHSGLDDSLNIARITLQIAER